MAKKNELKIQSKMWNYRDFVSQMKTIDCFEKREWVYYYDFSDNGVEELNLFDKGSELSDIYDAKRFQFGLNVGVGFNFGRFCLRYSFQSDLTNYATAQVVSWKSYGVTGIRRYDVKTRCQILSLGINF